MGSQKDVTSLEKALAIAQRKMSCHAVVEALTGCDISLRL